MKYTLSGHLLFAICYFFALLLYLGQFAPSTEKYWILLGAGSVVAVLPMLGRKRSITGLLIAMMLLAGFTAGMTSIRWMHNSTPLGKFRNVYSAIRMGMNHAEIENMVHREYPGLRMEVLLDESKSIINGPLYRGDPGNLIEVTMKDGRAIAKEFFPPDLFNR